MDLDPKKRLGVENKNEIKQHPFFEGIDWDDVLNKRLVPPFVDEGSMVEFPNRQFHYED